MANTLHTSGREVLAVDPSLKRRAMWSSVGGRVSYPSFEELPWDDVEAVFIVVRLTAQVVDVLRSMHGHVEADVTVFVCSTVEVEFAKSLGGLQMDVGRIVESPLSGGRSGAEAGSLTFMVAGDLDAYAEKLLLTALASRIVRFEKFGEPALAKLINNVTAAFNAKVYTELLLLGEGLGLDIHQLDSVMRTSTASSWVSTSFRDLIGELLVKDVALLRQQVGDLPDTSLDDAELFISRLGLASARLS